MKVIVLDKLSELSDHLWVCTCTSLCILPHRQVSLVFGSKRHLSSENSREASPEFTYAGGARWRSAGACALHRHHLDARCDARRQDGYRCAPAVAPSMMNAWARAGSDHGCLRMTARTRKRSSTQNGQWQSRAHARHGMLSCAQSMHEPQHAQTLKLPARTQD